MTKEKQEGDTEMCRILSTIKYSAHLNFILILLDLQVNLKPFLRYLPSTKDLLISTTSMTKEKHEGDTEMYHILSSIVHIRA